MPYKGNPIRPSADFSVETWQARREGHDVFRVLKGKPAAKNALSSEVVTQNKRRDEEFLKPIPKEFMTTK